MIKITTENNGTDDVVSSWMLAKEAPASVPANTVYIYETTLPVSLKVFANNFNKFKVVGSTVSQISGSVLNGRSIASEDVNNDTPMSIYRANKVTMFSGL
jgi:hypothetical protein